LKANDKFFRPHTNPIGQEMNTEMVGVDSDFSTFTDVPLGNKKGYFIIGAPST
jgi:hypothetical protein